jgi:hypothetical protein
MPGRKLPLEQPSGGQHAVITRRLNKSSLFKDHRNLRIVERYPRIERRDQHPVMHGAGMSGKCFGRLHMATFHRIAVRTREPRACPVSGASVPAGREPMLKGERRNS